MNKKKKLNTRHIYKQGFEKSENVIKVEGETLEKLQTTLFEMLKDFMKVAQDNSIRYTLSGGSVLGTIRHQGFIPWDDDIDINIERAEFEKLALIFERELGDRYSLYAPEFGKEHGLAHVQIKKKNTLYRSFNELSKEESGICIDLFIMESIPDNKILQKIHGSLCLATGYMLTCRKTYNDIDYLLPYLVEGKAKDGFMKKAKIGRLLSWLSLDSVSKLTYRCYSLCRNSKSKYVSIPSGRGHYFKERYLREDMCQIIEEDFEDTAVKIPKGYKVYLEKLYGPSYMELPKVEDREVHPLMDLEFEL